MNNLNGNFERTHPEKRKDNCMVFSLYLTWKRFQKFQTLQIQMKDEDSAGHSN